MQIFRIGVFLFLLSERILSIKSIARCADYAIITYVNVCRVIMCDRMCVCVYPWQRPVKRPGLLSLR